MTKDENKTKAQLIDELVELRESRWHYDMWCTEMSDGFALHKVICDENDVPVDYRFLEVNAAFEELTGLRATDVVGKTVLEVLPSTELSWIERYGRVAMTGEPVEFEEYSGALDRYYHVRALCPKERHFAVLFDDVTERKRAENKLQKTAHDLGERVKELNCLYGIAALVADHSKPLEEALQSAVELIPPSWQYPDVTCARLTVEGKTFQTEGFKETTFKQSANLSVNGKSVGVLEVCYLEEKPQSDEGPFLKEERFLISDIAQRLERFIEQKRLEEQLHRQATIVASSTDMLALLDRNFTYLSANEALVKPFGRTIDEIVGHTVGEVFGEEFHNTVLKPIAERCFVGEQVVTQGWIDFPISGRRHMDITYGPYFDPDNKVLGFIVNGRDSTAQKVAEEALRDSEDRFRNLLEMLPEAIFETDANINLTYGNQRALEMTGYSPDDLSEGLNGFDLLVPEDRVRAKTAFSKRLKGEVPEATEYLALKKDGSSFPILFNASSIIKDGEFLGVRGVIVDITERKQAETELLRFKLGIERSDEAIFITDPEGVFLYVNPAFEKIYGFAYEDVMGKTPRILKSGVIPEEVYEQFWKTLSSRGVVAGEIINKTEDGHLISMYSTANPILDDDSVIGYLAIQRDITEQKRAEKERQELEAQLQQAQKLESLGVLAGGIAHDFNNLLMGVLGNAELALADLSPVAPSRESIEGIQQAATRAAELAKQMLAYSGKGHFVVNVVSLSEVVQEMGHLLNASISKTTNLNYQLDETILPIEADVTQIRQVVMNLIINASEAVEDDSGMVRLTTGVMECDEACQNEGCAAGDCAEGKYSYLEVADTGVGMDEESISKIFDPFFTTKFTGRGLGLAAVFGIVRGHKGAIKVESKLGEGTTIRVLFPVTEKPAKSLRDSGESGAFPTIGGTILLVDDEPTVLDVGARMLEKAGYEVLSARDGIEAVEVFKEYSRNIDCVVLDLTMPKMGGEETFVELQKIRNDVPVLLSSGYSAAEVEARISAKGFAGFIEKPYRMNELKKSLREVLSK